MIKAAAAKPALPSVYTSRRTANPRAVPEFVYGAASNSSLWWILGNLDGPLDNWVINPLPLGDGRRVDGSVSIGFVSALRTWCVTYRRFLPRVWEDSIVVRCVTVQIAGWEMCQRGESRTYV